MASTTPRSHRRHPPTHPAPTHAAPTGPAPVSQTPAGGNTQSHPTDGPQFGQPIPTADPGSFEVPHPSDNGAYKILDTEQRAGELGPTAFPPARGGTEPVLTLEQVLGPFAKKQLASISAADMLVFHSVGDTGNVRSVAPQNLVADKLASDFDEAEQGQKPSFFFHLGDVIYNFGEAQYFYDQFYDPYREYPAPILALAGNHDGMVSPLSATPPLDAFLRNFCSETFAVTPEAGGLDRTAQIQPGVYFTFEAPFLRILALYSNTLEDPGVISSQGGAFPQVGDVQLEYLRTALQRIADEKFSGAVIVAHHHPAYTAGAKHGWSPLVTAEIDAICQQTGVWPHAVLSAHAHNYQRFTRAHGAMQIPYVVAGGGGHGIARLTKKGGVALRVPIAVQAAGAKADLVTLESYDDTNYGYLRIIVTATQLRIEYHPAADGAVAKTPDDFVTVDLASRTLVHFTG